MRSAAFLLSLSLISAGAALAEDPPAATPEAAPPPADAAPPPKPPKATKELLEKGKKAYETSCLPCHGEKGDGKGPVGAVLQPPPRDFNKDPFKQGTKPEEVFATISGGVKDTPMVGWPQISEEERWGLSYYVLEMVPKKLKTSAGKKKGDAAAK